MQDGNISIKNIVKNIMPNILIIDDEKAIRKTLGEILSYEGYKIDEAADGEEGLKKFSTATYDVVLCDIKMPKMDGIEFLEKAREINNDVPIIVISGHGNIETAVEAVKKGAFDYISKPPDLNRMLITLRNAMDKQSLVTETKVLKRKVSRVQEMVGNSAPIKKIKETIEKVAPTDARVLITGENGVGKELVARWIHERSNRNSGPIVEVNCAAIPGELIESELFGHEKGSFTSAIKQRIGKFEQANGGTLFLDEIGDMSLGAQAKVLRALQEAKITRVGADKDINVDVRVVATGVADRASARIAQLVYVDAFVPRDGDSVMSLLPAEQRQRLADLAAAEGEGWRLPPNPMPPDTPADDLAWAVPRRQAQPIATFTQPIVLTGAVDRLPRSYVYCTRAGPGDAFRPFAERARREAGWRCHELDASHNPQVTMPETLARLLIELAGA